jgi:hypothetical protein
MSKFEINRITKELIRAILRFRSSFLAPKLKENNIQRFFDISTGFRFSKISVECSVHSCSCPWLIIHGLSNFYAISFFFQTMMKVYAKFAWTIPSIVSFWNVDTCAPAPNVQNL